MPGPYRSLPSFTMHPTTTCHRLIPRITPPPVKMKSSATDVMTDLKRTPAVTVSPNESIDEANALMLAHKIRMLLVVDAADVILGLLTATDILGERPLRYLHAVSGRRSEILVRDIMTPREALEVLRLPDVVRARVGDIVTHLQQAGRQHALVVDYNSLRETDEVIGLFSTTQIGRQLGVPVTTTEVAHSFAEREEAFMAAERRDWM